MKKFLLLFAATLLFSCSSDNDDNIEPATLNYPVVGKWRLLSSRVGASQEEMLAVSLSECEYQHTLNFTSDYNVSNQHFGGEGCLTMSESISQWYNVNGGIYHFDAEHDSDGTVTITFSADFNNMTIDAYDGANYYSDTYVKFQ